MISFKKFRKLKTKIGHSLPNKVRNGMTALVVTGKMKNPENSNSINRYSEFRNKLLSTNKTLPKFKNS